MAGDKPDDGFARDLEALRMFFPRESVCTSSPFAVRRAGIAGAPACPRPAQPIELYRRLNYQPPSRSWLRSTRAGEDACGPSTTVLTIQEDDQLLLYYGILVKLTSIIFLFAVTASLVFATGVTRSTNGKSTQLLFDDFSYFNLTQLKKHGWIIRTAAGWPGIPGATWSEGGVSLQTEADTRGNRFVRMTSSTDGTPANTKQTQICHQRKYFEGTYATRVRFTDAALSGPSGDQIVQSFYTIAPLKAPMDPDYSELDFEYLPNGGWGIAGPTLYATTWETFSPEPNWKKDNVFQTSNGSEAGWHTLVTQVADQKVRYFVDGKLFAEHGGNYYPEDTMSINFNLWFIRDGMIKTNEVRQYYEDIDWVFFQANVGLKPEDVEAAVTNMQKKRIKFRDTVPAKSPALVSPCNF